MKRETNFIASASRLNNDYQQSIFYVSVSEEETRFKTPQSPLLPLWCVSQAKFDLINSEIGFSFQAQRNTVMTNNSEAHSHVLMHTQMHTIILNTVLR